MIMSWNWIGWVSWICSILFFCYVIHYIRVHQLMLIAKTKKAFEPKLVLRYVGLLLVSLCWLGAMMYLTFFKPVDINNHEQTRMSITCRPLQINNKSDDYYYVLATRSKSGKRPVVSYTYWTGNDKYTTTSRFGTVSDGTRIINLDASALPWNKKQLEKADSSTGHAFAAVMDVRYKNTVVNGLGLKANRNAVTYTLLRVPSSDMVSER